jgi:hypothetical protein
MWQFQRAFYTEHILLRKDYVFVFTAGDIYRSRLEVSLLQIDPQCFNFKSIRQSP